MKKIITVFLAAALLLSVFIGCAPASEPDDGSIIPSGPEEPVPEADGGQLAIYLNNQGYGRDWLDALADKFTELFGTEVVIIADPVNSVGTDAIGNETSQYDLVFSGGPLVQYVSKQQLVPINDVMATKPSGEDKTIAEKLNTNGLEYLFRFGENYYMMPWQTMFAGLHYNVNVLNDVFGEGKWEEPVTTDEFVAMLDSLTDIEAQRVASGEKTAATRSYGVVISPELNYWAYVVETWWAQYEGFDDFYNYYYGEYYDGETKKVATDAEGYEKSLDAQGRLEALKVLKEVLNEQTGHVNPVSEGLGYVQHQEQLASGKYQSNTNPSAFLSCGDWYEKETYSEVMTNGQPIRFMRTPVISSITEKLEDSDMDDATLASVIRAIDDGADSYEGVSSGDFDLLREARMMVTCGALGHPVAIPKNAKNVDNAKAFLVFMASDLGQSIFAQKNSGFTQPYGYDVSSDSSIVVSEYTKSINAAYKNGFLPVTIDYRSPLVTFGGLDNYGGQGYLDAAFWKGKDPAAFHNGAVSYEKSRYESVKQYIAATVRT